MKTGNNLLRESICVLKYFKLEITSVSSRELPTNPHHCSSITTTAVVFGKPDKR